MRGWETYQGWWLPRSEDTNRKLWLPGSPGWEEGLALPLGCTAARSPCFKRESAQGDSNFLRILLSQPAQLSGTFPCLRCHSCRATPSLSQISDPSLLCREGPRIGSMTRVPMTVSLGFLFASSSLYSEAPASPGRIDSFSLWAPCLQEEELVTIAIVTIFPN